MSSPVTHSMWLDDSDLMLGDFEPSLMTTAICPMSVFDKFGWDSEFLGPDTDELLSKICIKTEPEDIFLEEQDKINTDFGPINTIFPDLLDGAKDDLDIQCLKSILSPPEERNTTGGEKILRVKKEPVDELRVLPPSSNPPCAIKTEIEEQSEPNTNSVLRIPVKRSPVSVNPNFSKSGTGRTVKAIVVCPDRSKNIVCNVIRGTNKSIVIQKPISRSLLNVSGTRNESKLPIKVNVITPRDNAFGKLKNKIEPVETRIETPPETNLKEMDDVRPETPQSLIDEEYHPFSSPTKDNLKTYDSSSEDDFIKYCLLDEDNLSSESYKLMPPAEVTGQIQPLIPEVFKFTPNSSPTTNHGIQSDALDSFYSKVVSNQSDSPDSYVPQLFFNKAAANVDHDYGFTCRTPKSGNLFSTDNLGIQTPSASEPPTDSDDDDINALCDYDLLNEDFECSELDREQQEYFENLKHQLKMAELVCKTREKEQCKPVIGASIKERKALGRNRKRKLSINKNGKYELKAKIKIPMGTIKMADITAKFSTAVPTTTGTLKVRLPAKNSCGSSKRRKTGSGGRIFSPTERHLHNTNEQVRRIEMRQSFEELRHIVPCLYEKPRAAKVTILQEAKTYCDELFHNDCKMTAQIAALQCQQDRLKNSLSQLRRQIAAARN